MNFILENFYQLVTNINNYINKPKPSLIAPNQTQSTQGLQIKKVSTKIKPIDRVRNSNRVTLNAINSVLSAENIKKKNGEKYKNITINTDIHKYVFARCDTIHDFVLDTRGNSKIFDKVKKKVINQLNKTNQLNNDLISDYYSVNKNNDFGKKVKKILKGEMIPFQMSHVQITNITLPPYVYIYVKGEQGINYHSVQSGAYTIDYFKVESEWRKYKIITNHGTFIDQTDFTKYVLIDIQDNNGNKEANYKLELDKELILPIKTFTIKNLPVGGMWCKGDNTHTRAWNDIEQIEFENYKNDKNKFLLDALSINTEINNEEDDDEEDDDNNTLSDDSYICIYLYWSIAGKTSPYMIYVKISDISYDTLKNKYASTTYYYFDNYTKYKPSTFPKILETTHIIENTQQESFNFKSDTNIIFKKEEILGSYILFPPELLVKDLFNADYQGTWIANNKLRLNNSKPGKSYNDCVVELIENLTNIPKTINFHERSIFEYNGNSASLTMLNNTASNKFCSTYIVNNADIDSFVNNLVKNIFPPQNYNVAIDMDFSKISLQYIPILNTATLWDSSTASTVIISRQNNNKKIEIDSTIIETKNYPYIWFGENAIIHTVNSSDAVFKIQTKTFETVKSRRHLKGLNTTSSSATPTYIYKTVGLLKDRIAGATDIPNFVKPMSVAECINIKRSGDAFQIESIKTINSSSSVKKTFLLTGDQLFFCNCLISEVPVIHYYKTVDYQKTVFTIYNPFLLNSFSPLLIVGGTPSLPTKPEIILNCNTYCDLSCSDIYANTFEECIRNIDTYFLSIIKEKEPEDINRKYLCDRLEEKIEFEIDQDEETNTDAMLIYHNAEILRDRIILWGFEGFEILKILGLDPVQIPTDNLKDQLWVPYDTEMCILQVLHYFFNIPMLNECFQDIEPLQSLSIERIGQQDAIRRNVLSTPLWSPKPSVQYPALRGGFSKSKIRNLLFLRMLKKKKQIKIKLKQSISQTQQRP